MATFRITINGKPSKTVEADAPKSAARKVMTFKSYALVEEMENGRVVREFTYHCNLVGMIFEVQQHDQWSASR